MLALLSLLSIPPLSGFVGKLEVFKAAIDADQVWLAIVAVVNTVVSLFYYLRVIAPTVLEAPHEVRTPGPGSAHALTIALCAATVATVGFGVAAEPLLRVAESVTMIGT